tara:strand:- start:1079 stop:1258 length:180 start_codon:yes stop_codon:yes gene_type:complete
MIFGNSLNEIFDLEPIVFTIYFENLDIFISTGFNWRCGTGKILYSISFNGKPIINDRVD